MITGAYLARVIPKLLMVHVCWSLHWVSRKVKNVLAFCHSLTVIICNKSPGNWGSLMLRCSQSICTIRWGLQMPRPALSHLALCLLGLNCRSKVNRGLCSSFLFYKWAIKSSINQCWFPGASLHCGHFLFLSWSPFCWKDYSETERKKNGMAHSNKLWRTELGKPAFVFSCIAVSGLSQILIVQPFRFQNLLLFTLDILKHLKWPFSFTEDMECPFTLRQVLHVSSTVS